MDTMTPEQYEDTLIRDVVGYRHDPLGFVLYAFPWGEGELADYSGPEDWQREVLIEVGELLRAGEIDVSGAVSMVVQEAVASGHGIGKSAMVSWIILWAMSTAEDTKGVVTANTKTQLQTKTWAELAKWHRMCITAHWFEHTQTALISTQPQHENTWRIDCIPWTKERSEAFAGLHNKGKRILVIFDEASAIDDKIWEVVEGALTDERTEILWFAFGNPTRNSGRFRECFRKFAHRWKRRQIDSRTVRITNKRKIDEWVKDYGEDSDFVKVRVRGMFPSVSGLQYISAQDADAAFGRHLRPEQYNFAPVIIGVDPAWTGEDMFNIVLRQGLYSTVLRSIPKNDNDVQMANLIASFEDEYQADGVIIDLGWGTGIYSAGKTMGRDWMMVGFQDKSPDPGCLNMRAYMWKRMRDWLKAGGAIPPDQELHDSLTTIEFVERLDGKLVLESKKDLRDRGIPSPKADALAITFAYRIQKKIRRVATTSSNSVRDWDPFK